MRRTLPLCCLSLIAACADTATTAPGAALGARRDAQARIGTYVAMGTSLSMGVMSSGVVAEDQAHSWPAQLAGLAGIPFTQPLIEAPGCQPPIAPPLAALRRTNGESPFTRSAVCSPLVAGITAPTNNVALSEAIAPDAVRTTPQSTSPASWPLKGDFYARVLGTGQTQLTAMLAQQPDLVSVEFGGNEVLGARTGLVAPGVTVVPLAFWRPAYDQLIAGVKSTGARVLLVGLLSDATRLPSLRTGAELAADRAGFEANGITLAADCDGAARDNHVYVAGKVVGAYAQALAARAAGQPAPVLSCADVPGTMDFVLTPADIAALDAQLGAMGAHIRQVATEQGWAYFELEVLYGRRDLKAPFSVDTLLFSAQPYGPLISLDGVHPSRAGYEVFAREAAKALNVTYHLGISREVTPVATY